MLMRSIVKGCAMNSVSSQYFTGSSSGAGGRSLEQIANRSSRDRHGWTGSVSQGGFWRLRRLDWSGWTGAVMYSAFGRRSMTAGHAPQASSATRRGGSLAKNVIIPFRPSRFCMTILPSASSPVNLKDALGDIEPNRDSVHDGRSPRWVFSTRKLGAADAVGGRPPSIARSRLERRPSLRGAKRRSNPAESLGALRPSGSPGPRGSSPRVLAMTIMV